MSGIFRRPVQLEADTDGGIARRTDSRSDDRGPTPLQAFPSQLPRARGTTAWPAEAPSELPAGLPCTEDTDAILPRLGRAVKEPFLIS
jgi:hypothetical protein